MAPIESKVPKINLDEEYEGIVTKAQSLLYENEEWMKRYAEYASSVEKNLNIIKKNKAGFHQWAPLYLYMPVTEAKNKGDLFSLRYLGQDVAKLKVNEDTITISTKNFNTNNRDHFGCDIKLDDAEWKSKEAANFRNRFVKNPERNNGSGKKNEEHRIESLLLTEFSKTNSEEKSIVNIQPVKIGGIARFQMPTPLAGANIKDIRYSGGNGGGIDILARVGKGASTKLCIMEVKDKYESPKKVLQQGVAYATFIRELMRSACGEHWMKIFGFKGLPKKIELYVACVMPKDVKNDKFEDKTLIIGDDNLHLRYLYVHEKDNKILGIETSLLKCQK